MHHPLYAVFFHAVGLALSHTLYMLCIRFVHDVLHATGDRNCFYWAQLAGMVEGLCLVPGLHTLQPFLKPSFASRQLWNPAPSLSTNNDRVGYHR